MSYVQNESVHSTHKALFASKLTNWPNEIVLDYARLERVVMDKHVSLLGPFISSKENKVL